MTNKISIKPSHSLSVALLLVAITASTPLRAQNLMVLDVATPEFLRGETRPKSLALLPPQGVNQEFEAHARDHLTWLLNGKGYRTMALTVEQVNADPQLQELAVRANQRFNEELGVLLNIKWRGKKKKKVSQREVNLGADVSLLASKLERDGIVFARLTVTNFATGFGSRPVLGLHLGVVNGTTGDLETYFYQPVPYWSSPRGAMDEATQAIGENFPAVGEVIKAKGSTLKASAQSPKDKDATVKELETLLGDEDRTDKKKNK